MGVFFMASTEERLEVCNFMFNHCIEFSRNQPTFSPSDNFSSCRKETSARRRWQGNARKASQRAAVGANTAAVASMVFVQALCMAVLMATLGTSAAEVCLATRSGGTTATAPKKCSKLLDCKKNTTPCGHSRSGAYPTVSTTCCAADEQCSVDPDSGAAHKTKCTKLACAKGRQACGRVISILSNKHGSYLEQTPDDVCCAHGEECHFGYDNVSRCKKPAKCAKGHQACGNKRVGLQLKGPLGDYYLPGFLYSRPNNVCCAVDEQCESVDPGGFPGYTTACVKNGSSWRPLAHYFKFCDRLRVRAKAQPEPSLL
ncbi:hypothetical protein JKP88DRAFT_242779 [Tribonema minus]|uniref:Uncharacterized protein n=1 Tax=Tribonema minus TaxID=303371 RepID=A0A835ZNW0_9STRA|nr:hypothetical protein JKP88DRAFT_242779 [Tribonema minus]